MDKSRLRNALKKLRRIPFDRTKGVNEMLAPQEMLDFLATAAGLKPVFLLGRGFDDEEWVKGALACASATGLHVVNAPCWKYQKEVTIPDWYYEAQATSNWRQDVYYITKSETAARKIRDAPTSEISAESESDLLGYPLCCVRQHHQIQTDSDRLFYLLLQRTSKGDVTEALRLISEDIQMTPETPEELGIAEKVTKRPVPAPFTSFLMCDSCAEQGIKAPAAAVARKMYEFSERIDTGLTQEIRRASGM